MSVNLNKVPNTPGVYKFFNNHEIIYIGKAKDLKKRIIKETDIQIVNILSISKNTHRIILGPYNNINSLQKAFYSIRTLGFENIEIIKNG